MFYFFQEILYWNKLQPYTLITHWKYLLSITIYDAKMHKLTLIYHRFMSYLTEIRVLVVHSLLEL